MSILKPLKESTFFKKVLILFLGAGLAQVINLFLTTFLTRMYHPDQFGILAMFLTAATFLSLIASGRYELAILLPKEEYKAKSLVVLSVLLTLSFSVLIFFFFLFFSKNIAYWLKEPHFESWLCLIPISVFLISTGWIFNFWSIRKEQFKLLSIARIVEAAITGLTSIILKFYGTAGLIVGNLLGPFSTVAILSGSYFRQKGPNFKKANLKSSAIEYSAFPRVNILQSFVDLFQFSGLVLLFSLFFSAEIAGYYALCLRILQAPMGLLIKPVSQVYFSEASKALHQSENLYSLTYKTALRTAIVASPIPVIVLLFGPFLFSLMFGTIWEESGWYARIFVLWFYLDFIRSPISQVAILLKRQSLMLLISLMGNLLLVITLFAITKLALDIHKGFVIVSTIQVIYTLIIIRWLLSISKNRFNNF